MPLLIRYLSVCHLAVLALDASSATWTATIERDHWGVPHIKGERDADAAFGLGYAQAEDT